MHDIVLKGGMVVDGTGSPPFPADLAIDGDHIAALGRIPARAARRTIDVGGLLIAPGFVDMHTHSDLALLAQPTAEPKLMQGVVTEVIGQDGLSYAPVDDVTLPAIRTQISGWNGDPDGVDYNWRTAAQFLDRFHGKTSVNVAFLVPHGNVRMLVLGQEDRRPDAQELETMRGLVRQGMAEGAVGLSTGLSYTPASHADREELVALCEEVVPFSGFFAPHTRSYGKGVMAAYDEMFDVCERSGAALHLTHCQVSFSGNEGRASDLIERIDRASLTLDVTADSYCYIAGSTYLAAFLPTWAWHEGPNGVIDRLSDDACAERVRHELEEVGTSGFHGALIDWSTIRVGSVGSERNAACVGSTIQELAERRGVPPFEEARRLLIEENLNVNVLTFVGHEDNIRMIMRLPQHMAGSDGIMVGDLPHPRAWGTFARYLAHYARDEGLFRWEEVVRKMTSLPHRRLGQFDRGVLRPRMLADIVAFDPKLVRDTATYEHPKQHPEGIPYVLVNGVVVKDDGSHTGATPGRVLRSHAEVRS